MCVSSRIAPNSSEFFFVEIDTENSVYQNSSVEKGQRFVVGANLIRCDYIVSVCLVTEQNG